MSAAYSLTCPTCGNPFLANLGESSTIITCPHCAFNGPLQTFAAAGIERIGQAPSIPLRRREFIKREVLTSQPTPIHDHSTPPAISAHQNSHVDHQSHHFSPTSHPVGHPSTQPIPAQTPQPPLPTPFPQIAIPQHLPDRQSDPIQASYPTRPRATLSWGKVTAFLVASLIIAAGAVFLTQERSQELRRNRDEDSADDLKRTPVTATPVANSPLKVPTAQLSESLNSASPSTLLNDPLLELKIISAKGQDLIHSLFDSPSSERLQWVKDPHQNESSLNAFFSRTPAVTLKTLEPRNVTPIDLVTGQYSSAYLITTSANPTGALACISRSAEDSLKLHWPFFLETHDGLLKSYLDAAAESSPHWFHVLMRRTHGLDLPAELRATHHIIEIQAAATRLSSIYAIVAKELPHGRFIGQKCNWQSIYLGNVLMQKKALSTGRPMLEIIDCAGSSLTR